MKVLKKILWLLLIIFILIQFARPAKNLGETPSPNALTTVYPMKQEVQAIFKRACNDCHSNHSEYPWYSHIQPVGWWLNSHIKDGKRHFNLDEFMNYPVARQYKKLEETAEQVNDGEMPISSYTLMHGIAKLSEQDKKLINDWVEELRGIIKAKYPADSLILKRRPRS